MSQTHEFKYANTIRGITERIAFELGDAQSGAAFNGYDEGWVIARISDTFKWLQSRRPGLFAREVLFKLETSGDTFDVPEDCDSLIRVHTVIVDGIECPVNPTEFKNLRDSRILAKASECIFDLGIYHAAVDPDNDNSFMLSPPVPPGKDVSVKAQCSDASSFFKDLDKELDCDVLKWINAVVSFVVATGLSTDSDNPTNQSLGESHRQTFFDLAPIKRREEA